jgi:hypothetical protein
VSSAEAPATSEVELQEILCNKSEVTKTASDIDSAVIVFDAPWRHPGDSSRSFSYVRLFLPEKIHVTWFDGYHGKKATVRCVHFSDQGGNGAPASCGVSSVELIEDYSIGARSCSPKP